MAVKQIRSASRVLDILEAIARNQPIGLSELARRVNTDKSAVQRALTTLSEEGWIRRGPGPMGEWRLASRFHAIAHFGLSGTDLREFVRPALHQLRDLTGETAALNIIDQDQLIVTDVVETRHMLRYTPPIGMKVPLTDSASARAIFAWLPPERVRALLGREPDQAFLSDVAKARELGFGVCESTMFDGAVTIAAPIFEADGRPVAAFFVVAPRDRLPEARRAEVGRQVVEAARAVSLSAPAAVEPA